LAIEAVYNVNSFNDTEQMINHMMLKDIQKHNFLRNLFSAIFKLSYVSKRFILPV